MLIASPTCAQSKRSLRLLVLVVFCLTVGCGLLHPSDQTPPPPAAPTSAMKDLATRLADATLSPSQGGHYAIGETTRSSDGWMFLMRRNPQDTLASEVMIILHDNG